jgi:hypothetical protein
MWVSYHRKGLAKFNTDGRLLNYITKEKNHLPTNRIRIIRQLQNGLLIIGAEDGFFLLNPETLAIDSLNDRPALKGILRKRVVDILPDGDHVWIAASPRGGAYRYNFKTDSLRVITTKDGLSSNRVYCIAKDFYGNVYIGGYEGLNVLSPDGKITLIDKRNGLRHLRVDNLVADKEGRIWITDFYTLICYNPQDKSFVYFDEQNGVSNAGFTVGQSTLTKNGNILFCNNGLLIADTKILTGTGSFSPEVAVNRMYDDGGYDLLNSSMPVKLKYSDAKITLYYLASTLIAGNRFFYRYKMDGLDTGWQQPTKNNQVTYNLSPGKYVFHIQSSYNEGNWMDSGSSITIVVLPPWWQTWWFRLVALAFIAWWLYLLYRRRIRIIKTKAVVKQRMAELEGKALRAQMNPHFIFNSLNAIQELIVTENYTGSYQYLSKFSKLLRLVLHNSEKNMIPLSDEIMMNRLYLELESLRFKQSFHYSIETDDDMDADTLLFPSLLLQPFIENAIWHGLMQKEGEKKLMVSFTTNDNILSCIIEDNGIGRTRAAEIKAQKIGAAHFASKGTELARQRIEILQQFGLTGANIETTDIYENGKEPAGTRVEIKIPIQKINAFP